MSNNEALKNEDAMKPEPGVDYLHPEGASARPVATEEEKQNEDEAKDLEKLVENHTEDTRNPSR